MKINEVYSILYPQIESCVRFILSNQDMNVYSKTFGCIDRRYWGWKLADYPEATFQRNIYPVAWLLETLCYNQNLEKEVLISSVKAGLDFASKIQHRDGSFDQAFPNEHSYGATAFLLHPAIRSYEAIENYCDDSIKSDVLSMLKRSAEFLCNNEEMHGFISNHLAGAALGLLCASTHFQEEHFRKHSEKLIDLIINRQSSEGWYLEYEGADPGYQTLCVYYLAQIYKMRPSGVLKESLNKALTFLSHFIHPDGTFGGEYGSRRTNVYYPGGIALLSDEFPLAAAITKYMVNSIARNKTTTIANIDMGNHAPLLANYLLLAEALRRNDAGDSVPLLPCENESTVVDFKEAGIIVRGNEKYYSIIGISNGGVVKVFVKLDCKQVFNDSGYVAKLKNGVYLTNQITNIGNTFTATANALKFTVPFYQMLSVVNTPAKSVVLRLLNLTIMRNKYIGNCIKSLMVKMFITKKRRTSLCLQREITFNAEQITIKDKFTKDHNISLLWLETGRRFCAIHMASAGYFESYQACRIGNKVRSVDVEQLNSEDLVTSEVHL